MTSKHKGKWEKRKRALFFVKYHHIGKEGKVPGFDGPTEEPEGHTKEPGSHPNGQGLN